jgi:hypothetical protein
LKPEHKYYSTLTTKRQNNIINQILKFNIKIHTKYIQLQNANNTLNKYKSKILKQIPDEQKINKANNRKNIIPK